MSGGFSHLSFSIGEGGFSGGVGSGVPAGAGRGKGARGRILQRVVALIDGDHKVFASIEDLLAFLQSREATLEAQAERQGEAQAARILRVRSKGKAAAAGYKPPVKLVSGATAEAAPFIAETLARLERIYREALLGALARDAEEAEDIETIVSFL